MPDFGLTEALEAAMKAGDQARVMRPAEAELAARAAKAAPAASAPAVPGAAPAGTPAPLTDLPSAIQAPDAVEAPRIDPAMPPVENAQPAPPGPTAAIPTPISGPGAPVGAAPPDAVPGGAEAAVEQPPIAPTPPVDPTKVPPANVLPRPAATEAPQISDVQQAANRFVTANLAGAKASALNFDHMPNVDVMNSPDQLRASILQVAADNRGAIDAAARGTIPDEQMIGLAHDLSLKVDTVRQVLGREFGTALTPEVGLSARMIEQHQIGQIIALSDKVGAGTASSDDIIQWKQQEQLVRDFTVQLQGAKAEAGRGLRALGIQIPGGTPNAVKDHVASVLQNTDMDMAAKAKAIKLAGTPNGVANIVNGMATLSLPRRLAAAGSGLVQRIFINGILSGPPTWAKIFIGNNFNLALNTFDIFAAGVGRGIYGLAARLGGFPTGEEGAQISDAVAHVHGVISAGADALRLAGRVMKTGVGMDQVLRAGEGANAAGRMTTGQILPELGNSYFGGIARAVDAAIDAPGSRVISPIDEFTKTLGYRGYSQMMAFKEIKAGLAAGTLKPDDAAQVMTDLMQNPSPEMQQAAEAWAHRITFQTPFPEGGPGEAFQKVLTKAPALRFIFPFMRTATNIFKQSIAERTPLGLFSANIRRQIAAGGFEGDLARSRMATGTAIGSMLAWMAIHDRMTGDAPKDPKQRGEWSLDGRQPYSIRITDPISGKDTWRSYSWFEPMASIAGAVSDAVALQSYIHSSNDADTMMPHDDMLNDAIAHIMASVVTNVGNKTFLQGAAQFSEMYNDPQRAFAMWSDQMGANLQPFSGATKFVRNMQDPYMRQAYSLMDKVRDQLPTMPGVNGSKTLTPRLDVFGTSRMHNGGNSILGPLNPLPGQDVKKDPLTDEIQSLMEQTRTVPITMPSKQLALLGNGKGLQDGQGMRLTPEEYYDYTMMARHDPIFNGRTMTFRDKLNATINSPVYQESTPAERVGLLSHVQRSADNIARQRLWNEDPEFRERMMEWTAQKNRLKYGQ